MMDSLLPSPPSVPRQVVFRSKRLWESADMKRPSFCKLDQLVAHFECAHNAFGLKYSRSRSLWDLWWTMWQCNRFSVRVFSLSRSLRYDILGHGVSIVKSLVTFWRSLAASFLSVTIYRSTQWPVSEDFNVYHHGCGLWELKSWLHKGQLNFAL